MDPIGPSSANVIDADGHVVEPPNLWTDRAAKRFADRVPRIDLGDDGLERLVVEGLPDPIMPPGAVSLAANYGRPIPRKREDRRFLLQTEPGGWDPAARLRQMDVDGIDLAVVYPTLGLMWQHLVRDPALAHEICRIYNDWVIDEYCHHDSARLVPAIQLPLWDLSQTVAEVERCAAKGARAAILPAYLADLPDFGQPQFDPLWEVAESTGVSIGLHVSGAEHPAGSSSFYTPKTGYFWWLVSFSDELRWSLTAFFQGAVWDRFPGLTVLILEAGGGWIPAWLDRMDSKFPNGRWSTKLKNTPSTYFGTNLFVSVDPDESSIPMLTERVGADRIMWASDYPHGDAVAEPVKLIRSAVQDLTVDQQADILGRTAVVAYRLNGAH